MVGHLDELRSLGADDSAARSTCAHIPREPYFSGAKMDGWVKLHRSLLSHELWLTEPFTRGQAWVDLVGLANYTDGHIRVRGNRVDLKRGQVGWSQLSLCARWKWSRGKVERFLDEFERDGRIVQQKNRVSTVLTILNYDLYQSGDTTDGQQTGQQTDNRQDNRQDTNKKEKKEKKEKNITSLGSEEPASSDDTLSIFDHWNSYVGRTAYKGNQKITWHAHRKLSPEIQAAIKARLKDYPADELCAAIDNYATVLFGAKFYWSYAWALHEFLSRHVEKTKGAPLQVCGFLPDNFHEEKYLSREEAKSEDEGEYRFPTCHDLTHEEFLQVATERGWPTGWAPGHEPKDEA